MVVEDVIAAPFSSYSLGNSYFQKRFFYEIKYYLLICSSNIEYMALKFRLHQVISHGHKFRPRHRLAIVANPKHDFLGNREHSEVLAS